MELEFLKLISLRKYIEWLIYKKVSIIHLPFDLIFSCILPHMDLRTKINFVYAIYPHFKNETNFNEYIKELFFISETYRCIDNMSDYIYQYYQPHSFILHIHAEWSTFSKNVPLPLATIRMQNVKPYQKIQYNDKNITNSVNTQLKKGIYQLRLSGYVHSTIYINGWYKYKARFRRFYYPSLPLLVKVVDMYNNYFYCDHKVLYLHDFWKL